MRSACYLEHSVVHVGHLDPREEIRYDAMEQGQIVFQKLVVARTGWVQMVRISGVEVINGVSKRSQGYQRLLRLLKICVFWDFDADAGEKGKNETTRAFLRKL